jgi:hypothetical protein
MSITRQLGRQPRDVSASGSTNRRDSNMDNGRIDIISEHVEGSIKEATGTIIGDAGLTADGKAEKAPRTNARMPSAA